MQNSGHYRVTLNARGDRHTLIYTLVLSGNPYPLVDGNEGCAFIRTTSALDPAERHVLRTFDHNEARGHHSAFRVLYNLAESPHLLFIMGRLEANATDQQRRSRAA